MLNFIKIHKRDLVVGAVGSLIASFAIWIVNWFISTAPKIGPSVLETILNIIYTSAATQTINYAISLIFCGLLGIGFGSIFLPFKEIMASFIKVLKIEKELKTLPDNAVEELNKRISLGKRSDKSNLPPKKVDDILKERKHFGFQAIKVFLLAIVLFIIAILFIITPINIRDKFDLDITIISPYVEEQQILQLKSDWVLMRSKADYTSIYEYIDTVKEKNNLSRQ